MLGITVAASLGFAFGATFKRGWIVLHGPMAAASSVITYAVVMRLI